MRGGYETTKLIPRAERLRTETKTRNKTVIRSRAPLHHSPGGFARAVRGGVWIHKLTSRRVDYVALELCESESESAMALTFTSWAVAPFSSTKSLGQAQLCSPAQSRHACHAASSSSSSSKLTEIRLARDDLLGLIATEERGVKTQHDATKRAQILEAIETLGVPGREQTTTDADALSATWRMLWTTEKEQLFIIDKSPLFGTRAGEVLQVIDVQRGTLNNVITFPPSGSFVVDSTIEVVSKQRVNFRFIGAALFVNGRRIAVPPFGKGWFESVYLDDSIRVAKDIRGDYLVVDRAPYDWNPPAA